MSYTAATTLFMMSVLIHRASSMRLDSFGGSMRSLVRGIFGASSPKHVTLTQKDLREKVCIIGDVHGCLDELKDLLDLVYKANVKEKTTVIFAGDLVNKGPYSAEVVEFARTMDNAHCVRGNHDDYIVKRSEMEKKGFKAQPWESKLCQEDRNYLKSLPYTISLPSLNAAVVHAGIIPNKSLEEQREFDMMMMRNVVAIDDGADAGYETNLCELKALIHENEGKPWAAVWDEQCKAKVSRGDAPPPHIYFGHDAKRLLQSYDYATGLDTGCCYGKQLTAVILPEKTLVQVQAREVYEVPGGVR